MEELDRDLAEDEEAEEAVPGEGVGPNLVDQMRLRMENAVLAARAGGIAGIRTVANAQLRDLSDKLFALKETMPDESFRQLSDALMSAHNRVAA